MRHTIWTLLLTITVGAFAFAAGWNAHTPTGPEVLNAFQTDQAHVVLAKSATRQQNGARQQNEGCLVPDANPSQKKYEHENSVMKGLVF